MSTTKPNPRDSKLSPEKLFNLGRNLIDLGRVTQVIQAISLFERLAKQNYLPAQLFLYVYDRQPAQSLRKKDISATTDFPALLKKHAAQFEKEQQETGKNTLTREVLCCLQIAYRHGISLPKNVTQATAVLATANLLDDPLATLDYAQTLQNASEEDPSAAYKLKVLELMKKAAEQGSVGACQALGNCYQEGYGVSKDSQEQDKWYDEADRLTAEYVTMYRQYEQSFQPAASAPSLAPSTAFGFSSDFSNPAPAAVAAPAPKVDEVAAPAPKVETGETEPTNFSPS